ncbi:NAD(P)H-binding protein [Maribius pontilimi]|uniref:Divinyl chlorophyllide a 8-vinyl-reductase, chloroplastic n=1 Tax=Palleronia pontilimi TaxID=1964209 RepID=A0A934MAG7_9RHOB|nr:NAD(P)H-binding protein [Palleronia pontilimi]MBJ3763607.1 NAD(P)H-binding protein [Palleronia pontilimi]
MRIFLLGATGTIGRATCAALLARGHAVVCLVRPGAAALPVGAIRREGDVTDPASLRRDGVAGERFDALVSCLASRTGAPDDAWALDHRATVDALAALRDAGARRMVLLSALCVQKPRLAFQHAKLAAERAIIDSGLAYSIVRPTAFFKSLSGQIDRLRAGKPFLVFGDGRLTACKPISDRDLAQYLADCLERDDRRGRILPIGGPGPAITPLAQGRMLFELLDRSPRFRRVPPGLLGRIAASLGVAGRIAPRLRAKAELARIGQYYATESMLVWDGTRYDADATPETGSDTLRDHYARLIREGGSADLGAHAVFGARPDRTRV